MLPGQSGSYRIDTFHCKYCGKNFQARVTTWVDVSKAPGERLKLLHWKFNMVRCPFCGDQALADSPFFYEDFEEGILLSVFPTVPDRQKEVEEEIRAQYSHYPYLEFFYDMTQLWVLVYLYFYHRQNGYRSVMATIKEKEEMTKRSIQSIKTDVIMLHIREKILESFYEPAAYDELLNAVERLICSIEETCSYRSLTGTVSRGRSMRSARKLKPPNHTSIRKGPGE
jgi:hypothetical protein